MNLFSVKYLQNQSQYMHHSEDEEQLLLAFKELFNKFLNFYKSF